MSGDGTRFRAGIVGAGLISEHHFAAIESLPDVDLVGVFDLVPERADARAVEWGTPAHTSLEALVEAGANVIHVLTPPTTHADVAVAALELGCHVLVEKPLAASVEDGRRIAAAAESSGRVATVSHSLLYDPQVMAALEEVEAGRVGEVVGVDVFRSQHYPPYEGGPLPPHLREAGYPWRDVGIHCLYLIRELLGEIEDMDARWLSLGGDPNLAYDEWRGLVRCERGLGQFQLSWNSRPPESQLVIHGSQGMLRVDLFAMYRARRAATPLPKAAERAVNAYAESLRPLVEGPMNAMRFLRGRIQPYQGVRNLVADFYERLGRGEAPRTSLDDAIGLVDWLERVARAAEDEHAERVSEFALGDEVDFLVTGASGSLGSAVLRRLAEDSVTVRAFVRRAPERPIEGVEYAIGNLGDPVAVDRAVAGAKVVIHAGAAMRGPWEEHHGATVVGTRNVIEACNRHGVRQLVHISSLSVINWAGAGTGRPIDETTPLEPRAEERGSYTRAKLQAELDVSAAASDGLECVILRPGVIFGGGIPLIGPGVARRAGGRWVLLGNGDLTVPLVYIDDVVDAIMAAVERGGGSGEVIQLIDEARLTQREILSIADPGGRRPVRIPKLAAEAVGGLSEIPLRKLGRQSPIGRYRLRSALAQASFNSDRARELLGWTPRVGVIEGIRRVGSQGENPDAG